MTIRFSTILCGAALLGALFATSQAQATVVESWDSGAWGSGWANVSGAQATVTGSAAHDGAYGVSFPAASGIDWTANDTLTATIGDAISLWVQPTALSDGRLYLGIGDGAGGRDSLVVANNTDQFLFQNNAGSNFTNVTTASQAYQDGAWYRIELDWVSASDLVGKLFDSSGTLLNSITQTTGIETPGTGLALRGFGGWNADTLSVAPIATQTSVPEPATWTILLAGFAGLLLVRSRGARTART